MEGRLKCEESVNIIRDDTSRNLTVKVTWFKNNFDLTIFNGVNTYYGTMEEDEIVKITNQLGTITVDDYIKECKSALTTSDGSENFIYIIDNNVFKWKKVAFDMKITFGSVKLSEVPLLETLNDMLNVLVVNNNRLQVDNKRLSQEKTSLENDNKEMLQKAEEYIHMKSDTEFELLNQFLVVLNTKKKKILQLEKLLKANKVDVNHIENEDVTTIDDLYECDTEAESNSENTDEEVKETQQESTTKSKSKHKKLNFLDSESDSDEANLICNIPKRYNRTSKNVDKVKDNAVKQKGKDKPRISNKRENEQNCAVEKAGPSGIKLPKLDKHKNSESNKGNIDSTHENDSRINVFNECRDKENCDNSSKCDNKNDNQEINNAKKCTSQPSNGDNSEKESSIDDILAGLIA